MTTSRPASTASSSTASSERDWVMVTISPRPIMNLMIAATGRPIAAERSLTLTPEATVTGPVGAATGARSPFGGRLSPRLSRWPGAPGRPRFAGLSITTRRLRPPGPTPRGRIGRFGLFGPSFAISLSQCKGRAALAGRSHSFAGRGRSPVPCAPARSRRAACRCRRPVPARPSLRSILRFSLQTAAARPAGPSGRIRRSCGPEWRASLGRAVLPAGSRDFLDGGVGRLGFGFADGVCSVGGLLLGFRLGLGHRDDLARRRLARRELLVGLDAAEAGARQRRVRAALAVREDRGAAAGELLVVSAAVGRVGLGAGELALGLDVDLPAGQARCETGVEALLADRERKLIVRHDDGRLLGVVVDVDLAHAGRRERAGHVAGRLGVPLDDVDLLAAELRDDHAHAGSARADAGADRVDALSV